MTPDASATSVVVIGAGQAGLAVSFYLQRLGLVPAQAFVLLDRGPGTGGAWQLRWEALGDGAKEKLREVFQHADLLKLEPPKSTKRAVALNAGDGIVAPGSTGKLAKHWGVEPLTLRTGHTGAYVFERRALQRLISDTLR